jgi:porphobilinogen synthase
MPDNGIPLFARYRRLRSSANLRRLIGETRVSVDDFIYPLFITAGQNVKAEIPPMPDCYQLSVDRLSEELDEIEALGIPGVLLFGLPAEKDPVGSDAYADNGIIQQAVREAKRTHPDLLVITDVCLCEYTDLGHCGVVLENGTVDNDATIDLLAKEAVSHARAGADLVAPSSMMAPHRARRRRVPEHAHHGVRRKVLIGVVRPVPRRRGLRPGVRRSTQLPDGPG